MFAYPMLLWALPLVLLVVLIHFINVVRHRPVSWGAMEFVLIAYKKSRNRILLQQFLLMLFRSLIILCLIFLLAQPHWPQSWSFFGRENRPQLHLVLLDDSFSMSDTYLGESAIERAQEIAAQIVGEGQTRGHRSTNRLSLLRFSQETFDFKELMLDQKGTRIAQEKIRSLPVSETDVGPQQALIAAFSLLAANRMQSRCTLYLLSDFRKKNWESPDSLQKLLNDLKNLGVDIRLIRTVDSQHPNLSLLNVRLLDGICAAEIPVLFEVTIANFGPDTASNITCSVHVNDRFHSNLSIPNLESSTDIHVRFPLTFEQSGPQKVEVKLEPDSVMLDNTFPLIVDVPQHINVLLIVPNTRADFGMSTEPTESGSKYIKAAIAPEGVKTGIRVQTEPTDYLDRNGVSPPFVAASDSPSPSSIPSSATTRSSSAFSPHSIDLVVIPDLSPLSQLAVQHLEQYVRKGGNVVFFCGPETEPNWVNEQLFRNNAGLFPIELGETASLFRDFLDRRPDLTISASSPLFRVFEREGQNLLNSFQVSRYFKSSPQNLAESVQVLASLRNADPLILKSSFGKGQVVTFLTTASPLWNNWGRGNPGYVVLLLEIIAHLNQNPLRCLSQPVLSPISIQLDPLLYEETVAVIPPSSSSSPALSTPLNSLPVSPEIRIAEFSGTERSGFYEIEKKRRGTEEGIDRNPVAVHVNGEEGNLTLVNPAAFAESFKTVGLRLEDPASFTHDSSNQEARPLTGFLLLLLLFLLFAETLITRQGLSR